MGPKAHGAPKPMRALGAHGAPGGPMGPPGVGFWVAKPFRGRFFEGFLGVLGKVSKFCFFKVLRKILISQELAVTLFITLGSPGFPRREPNEVGIDFHWTRI